MADQSKRAFFARLAVALAVIAFPLVAAGAAQAAIAGAIPATTTGRPDLRSATILTSTTVEVCYDKTLSSSYGGVAGDFYLFGYRSFNRSSSPTSALVDPTNPDCVIVTWPASGAGSVGDLTQYTGVQDLAGAVEANTGGAMSLEDGVGLTGSITHAGTTGNTTAPNLVGIEAPTGTNLTTDSLSFVFDKAVGATPAAAAFFFVDAAGTVCIADGTGYLSGGGTTTITISFTGGLGCGSDTVADAVRGGVLAGGVVSASDPSDANPDESTILPNAPNGGATQRPDLVSAALASGNSDAVTFTFDKSVVVANSTDFVAVLADGGRLFAGSTGCTGNGGTTVTCSFGGQLSPEAEYAVIAWAGQGAVESADNVTTTGENTPGSAPVGDNAGAFARGFTTGPDVFAVAINHTTGVVTVNLDQRIEGVEGASDPINLLDSSGDTVPATGTPSFNSSAPPGPEVLTLTYPPSALTNVTQVQFTQYALYTALNGLANDQYSISQIVGATSSSAILKAYRAKVAGKHAQKHHTKARSKRA